MFQRATLKNVVLDRTEFASWTQALPLHISLSCLIEKLKPLKQNLLNLYEAIHRLRLRIHRPATAPIAAELLSHSSRFPFPGFSVTAFILYKKFHGAMQDLWMDIKRLIKFLRINGKISNMNST